MLWISSHINSSQVTDFSLTSKYRKILNKMKQRAPKTEDTRNREGLCWLNVPTTVRGRCLGPFLQMKIPSKGTFYTTNNEKSQKAFVYMGFFNC